MLAGTAVGKIPEKIRKALFAFDVQIKLCTFDGADDFRTVAHNACVLHQAFDFFVIVAGYFLWLETVKCFAELFALAQNRDPGQARLKTVQNQLFKQSTAIKFRHTPIGVMIMHVKRINAGPGAAFAAVAVQDYGRLLCHVR